VLHQVGEALLLAADDGFDLSAWRDVLHAPDDVARQQLERRGADVAPLDVAVGGTDGDLGMAGNAGGRLRLQLGQPVSLRRFAGHLRFEQRLHRPVLIREHAAIGGGGEDDAAIGRHDLACDRQGVEAGGEEVALAPRPQPHVQEDGGARQKGERDAAGDAAPQHGRDAFAVRGRCRKRREESQQGAQQRHRRGPAPALVARRRPPAGDRAIHGPVDRYSTRPSATRLVHKQSPAAQPNFRLPPATRLEQSGTHGGIERRWEH
jgi:hypothetical protein